MVKRKDDFAAYLCRFISCVEKCHVSETCWKIACARKRGTQVFETVASKGGCTAPTGAIGLPDEAPEVGLSERGVRSFTVEVIIDRALGNFYHFVKGFHRIKNLLTMKRWYIQVILYGVKMQKSSI
jgi:hypothetical protein